MQPPIIEGLTQTSQLLALLTAIQRKKRPPQSGTAKPPVDKGPKSGPITGGNIKTPI